MNNLYAVCPAILTIAAWTIAISQSLRQKRISLESILLIIGGAIWLGGSGLGLAYAIGVQTVPAYLEPRIRPISGLKSLSQGFIYIGFGVVWLILSLRRLRQGNHDGISLFENGRLWYLLATLAVFILFGALFVAQGLGRF